MTIDDAIKRELDRLSDLRRRHVRMLTVLESLGLDGANTNRLGDAKRAAIKAAFDEANAGLPDDLNADSRVCRPVEPFTPNIINLSVIQARIDDIKRRIELLDDADTYDFTPIESAYAAWVASLSTVPDNVRRLARTLSLDFRFLGFN